MKRKLKKYEIGEKKIDTLINKLAKQSSSLETEYLQQQF